MALVNNSYFIGERNIPNINAADISSTVSYLISKYEEEYLTKALGYELFKLFSAAISGSPAQKYIDLRDGKEFTNNNGLLVKWGGFVNIQNSPIADYVYYQWLLGNASQTTGIGQVQPNAANSVQVTPQEKICKFWNKQAKTTLTLVDFLNANMSTYPEFSKYSVSQDLELLTTRINPFFN